MSYYPGYEVERFEDEGGSTCRYRYYPPQLEMEEIPVNYLAEAENAGEEEIKEHQE